MKRNVLVFMFLTVVALFTINVVHATGKTSHKKYHQYELLILKGKKSKHGRHHRRSLAFLWFEAASPSFNYYLYAFGLKACRDYTLIYFPHPWPNDNLVCLGHGTSNEKDRLKLNNQLNLNMSLPAPYDENYPQGAQLQLVLSNDLNCYTRRFLVWQPKDYLTGKRLIKYTDTDIITDFSGNYCLRSEEESGGSVRNINIEQSGSYITISLDGYSFTGTITGNTATTSGIGPDALSYTIEVTFANNGETFIGTVSTVSSSFEVTGSKGLCYDYQEPVGDPECVIPVQDLSLVIDGQQFNSVSDTTVHDGLDFAFDTPLPTILAPCDGVVVNITTHPIHLDNLIIDVEIRYNTEWSTFIAFEPYSPSQAIADQQRAEIAVTVGQVISKGDVLGRLVVPDDTEFPVIHWGLLRVGSEGWIPVCGRDYLSPTQQSELDAIYASFGKLPVCLPAP